MVKYNEIKYLIKGDGIMDWIIQNKDWLFSGIGVTIIVGLIGIFIKSKFKDGSNKKQIIKSGDHSTNIQGGRDVNITFGDKHD
jgi:hypothetical protein